MNNLSELLLTIESIIKIDYLNKQIIILDEYNLENSVLNNLVKRFDIKHIKSKDVLGIFNLFNLGITISNGDYYLLGVSGIKYSDKILINLCNYFKDGSEVLEFNLKNRHKYHFITMSFSKKIFDTIGFFDTYDLFSDWDFVYRIKKIYYIININLDFVHFIQNSNISLNKGIMFKNYFSNLKNRIFIPYQNYIKYPGIKFDREVYSNTDILVSLKENSKEFISCTQYLKINIDNKYLLKNMDLKHNIMIHDIHNKCVDIFSDHFIIFEIGKYTIKYTVEDNIESINPIIITFHNQTI